MPYSNFVVSIALQFDVHSYLIELHVHGNMRFILPVMLLSHGNLSTAVNHQSNMQPGWVIVSFLTKLFGSYGGLGRDHFRVS